MIIFKANNFFRIFFIYIEINMIFSLFNKAKELDKHQSDCLLELVDSSINAVVNKKPFAGLIEGVAGEF